MNHCATNDLGRFNRRHFLRAATAASTAFAVPWTVPASVFGGHAPSTRIHVGCIGAGNQTTVDLPAFLRNKDVQVVAICDVNRASHGYRDEQQYLGREPQQRFINDYYARETGIDPYQGCAAYSDFRELLACDDIDAVMLVVPDQWHAYMTVAACRAGKDIYCEKPLSLTVHDGQIMTQAVRQYERILQTGSQYRSSPEVRHGCELVLNGRIGQLKTIRTRIALNNKVGPGPGWEPAPVPDGFDYPMWLGPAPDAPYHPRPLPLPVPVHPRLLGGADHQFRSALQRHRPVGPRDEPERAGGDRAGVRRLSARGELVHHGREIEVHRAVCRRRRTDLRVGRAGVRVPVRGDRGLGRVRLRRVADAPRIAPGIPDRTAGNPLAAQRAAGAIEQLARLHHRPRAKLPQRGHDATGSDRAGRNRPPHGQFVPSRQHRAAAQPHAPLGSRSGGLSGRRAGQRDVTASSAHPLGNAGNIAAGRPETGRDWNPARVAGTVQVTCWCPLASGRSPHATNHPDSLPGIPVYREELNRATAPLTIRDPGIGHLFVRRFRRRSAARDPAGRLYRAVQRPRPDRVVRHGLGQSRRHRGVVRGGTRGQEGGRNSRSARHWTVEDGELVNDGDGPYLTTEREYGDIELLIDYRTVPKADSGIYLRGLLKFRSGTTPTRRSINIGAGLGVRRTVEQQPRRAGQGSPGAGRSAAG
jgi:hypothetical protein